MPSEAMVSSDCGLLCKTMIKVVFVCDDGENFLRDLNTTAEGCRRLQFTQSAYEVEVAMNIASDDDGNV